MTYIDVPQLTQNVLFVFSGNWRCSDVLANPVWRDTPSPTAH